MKKVLKIIGIILAVLIAAIVVVFVIASKRPMIAEDYYDHIETGGEIEAKYTAMGTYEVKSKEYKAEGQRWKNYTVWYPAELESASGKYPLVVMANGTGVQNYKYTPVFKHLASWGFIVVGNDDDSSATGDSTELSLQLMLNENDDPGSIFFRRIDTDNIGVTGHSQGGVAVIHALYATEHSDLYKSGFALSATTEHLIDELNLETFRYDISKVNVPLVMVAGTLPGDAESISPLADMQTNFENATVPTMIARRTGADHGDVLTWADGYMTAWFRYMLMDDEEAAKAFVGDTAEIMGNPNWQDQQSKGFTYIKMPPFTGK